MPSSLSWTDAEGSATLTNGKITPGDRFADWTVSRRPIGPEAVQLSTGRIQRTEYRRDQLVVFELRHIPEDQMSLLARLQYHLLKGGEVRLTGDRAMVAQFATCVVAPDTEPDFQQSDSQLREFTFSVVLRSWVAGGWGGGGGPGPLGDPVDPPTVPDLMIWYKADALLPTHGNGDPVTVWLDSSGNDIDAISASGDLGTMNLDEINGLPVVDFPINQQLFSEDPLPGWPATEITGRTLFGVFRDNDPERVAGDQRACGFEAFSSWRVNEVLADPFEGHLYVRTGYWAWCSDSANAPVEVQADIAVFNILTVRATKATGLMQLYVNSVPVGDPFAYGGNILSDLTYFVNGYTAVGGSGAMLHAEHMVYNRDLTDAEIDGVHAYLIDKYFT